MANESLSGPGGEQTVELSELIKFLRKIFSIKERWATAYRPRHFTCDLHSLARSDAVCNLIKSRLYQRANLIELIKLVEDIDRRIDQRCLQTADEANCKQMVHSPIFRQINAMFSKFAFEHMCYQFMLSHRCKVTEFKRFNFTTQRLRETRTQYSGQYYVQEWHGQQWITSRCTVEFEPKTQGIQVSLNLA